jgi:hypothetical protein
MAKAAAEGIRYQPGGILATTTTVTIFIDIFIGVWTFILGYNLDQLHRQKGRIRSGSAEFRCPI